MSVINWDVVYGGFPYLKESDATGSFIFSDLLRPLVSLADPDISSPVLRLFL